MLTLGGAAITPAWRGRVAAAVSRTRALFRDGLPLCDAVRGRLRYELRATWLGGTRILDRLEAVHFDVAEPSADHRSRPTIAVARVAHARVVESIRGAAATSMSRDTSFYYSFLVLPPRKRKRDRRRLGFLPRGGRCGRRSGAGAANGPAG